jgi:ankyrin repeat protein
MAKRLKTLTQPDNTKICWPAINMKIENNPEQKRLDIELRQAMYARDYEKSKRLIDKGADPNTKNGWGSPFIYWCSENGRIDLIDLALEKGGDINAVNKNGETALHKVAQLGRSQMIDPLLERGAGINHKNIYDATPLFVAAQSNQIEVVKKLLSRGGDPTIRNHKGFTAAQKAVEKGYDEIAALLAVK